MEIAPGIYSMGQRQGVFAHAYLVDDGAGLTLIDTLYTTDAATILAELSAIGRAPTDIRRILLTHAHRAHLGGLALLKAASSAPVLCHAWEADIVRAERRQQCMSLKPTPPYRVWPFQVASRFGSHPGSAVDGTLSDGERVGPLVVVAAPGHTPGHVAFHWPERKALFAGDAIVTWPRLDPGWAGFNLNNTQNLDTLHRLATFDVEVVGGGHGEPIVAGGGERIRELARERGV